MLTDPEVRQLLAVVMAYDNRKPGQATIAAWTEAARRGRWTFGEAIEAVHAYFVERSDWLMPAHITHAIRAGRQDAALRQPEQRPEPLGQARVAELVSGVFSAISRDDSDPGDIARRAALARSCPYCSAKPDEPCTRRGTSGRVRLSKVHPSRLEEAS